MLGQFIEAHSVVNMGLFLSKTMVPLGFYLKACILARESKLNTRIHEDMILNYLNKCIALDKSFKAMIYEERLFRDLHKVKGFKELVKSEIKKCKK